MDSIISEFEGNEKAEKEGVWMTLRDGFDVKVACAINNDEFSRHLQKLHKPYRAQGDKVSPKVLRELNARAAVEHLFLAFKGDKAVDKEGQPLEDTKENRLMLMRMPHFYSAIDAFCTDLSLFALDAQEDELGN